MKCREIKDCEEQVDIQIDICTCMGFKLVEVVKGMCCSMFNALCMLGGPILHGRHLLARTACFTQISLSRDYLPTGQRLITSCWELM